MQANTHNIDPDGDVVIILSNQNTNFADWNEDADSLPPETAPGPPSSNASAAPPESALDNEQEEQEVVMAGGGGRSRNRKRNGLQTDVLFDEQLKRSLSFNHSNADLLQTLPVDSETQEISFKTTGNGLL